MTTILMLLVSVVAFLAYCLYERHKYFNKYKLKRETYSAKQMTNGDLINE